MTQVDPEYLYTALIGDTSRLGGVRRMQYRCQHRCLLLDALAVGDTVLLHQKRFKNSPAVNARRSSDAGRKKNTTDGLNHWRPRSYFIEQSALAYPQDLPMRRISLQCDHVGVLPNGDDVTLGAPHFHDDWAAGHAAVTVRPDGTRFVVH